MVIQHNLPALNAHRQLAINNSSTSKNLEKLSSGFRVNRAADDAAGLAISEKMRGQIRGLGMAETNADNGISLIQTAEGGLNETHAILQRMRELAVQSANGTYQDDDRLQIDKEMQALKSEIDRIATSTHYNGIKVLDGTMGGHSAMKADGSAIDTEDTVPGHIKKDTGITGITFAKGADFSGEMDATTTISVKLQTAGTTNYIVNVQIGDATYTGIGDITAGAVTLKRNGDGTGFESGDTVSLTLADLTTDAADGLAINGLKFNVTGANTGLTSDTRYAIKTDKLMFQIGANGHADQRVGLHVDNMSSGMIGSFATTLKTNASGTINGMNIRTQEGGRDAIDVIDKAIIQVAGQRAEMGALQNRLEHTLNNLGVTKENLTAAESSIRDVDMAKEMMEFQKNNILVQASQAMLAQANALPQGVLQLLR
jgi:flagellin